MSQNGTEREHQRHAHEAFITVHVKGKTLEGRTNNVSRGGLCAILETGVPVGTEVEVDLQLVFDDDVRTDALRIPARVVWCTMVNDAQQIGLSFKSLDATKTELMNMFLRYLDEGPVAKRGTDERSVDDRFR